VSAVVPRGVGAERATASMAARRVCVRWIVSRGAAAGLIGCASRPGECETELEITAREDGTVRAVLRWKHGSREIDTGTGATHIGITDDEDLTHWRITVGGVRLLDATVDGRGVVYARTPLLASIGLAGGRYEVDRDAGSDAAYGEPRRD